MLRYENEASYVNAHRIDSVVVPIKTEHDQDPKANCDHPQVSSSSCTSKTIPQIDLHHDKLKSETTYQLVETPLLPSPLSATTQQMPSRVEVNMVSDKQTSSPIADAAINGEFKVLQPAEIATLCQVDQDDDSQKSFLSDDNFSSDYENHRHGDIGLKQRDVELPFTVITEGCKTYFDLSNAVFVSPSDASISVIDDELKALCSESAVEDYAIRQAGTFTPLFQREYGFSGPYSPNDIFTICNHIAGGDGLRALTDQNLVIKECSVILQRVDFPAPRNHINLTLNHTQIKQVPVHSVETTNDGLSLVTSTLCPLLHEPLMPETLTSQVVPKSPPVTHTYSSSVQVKTEPKKSYYCSYCDKSFLKAKHLRVHELIHTGAKIWKCSLCKKTFNLFSSFSNHKRIHAEERPYPCPDCGKKFIRLEHLKTHERVHTGEKPFQCNSCDKKFSQVGNLRRHELIHQRPEEKPFQCSCCGKKLVSLQQLKVHQRIHTGERPYRCAICSKGFITKSRLKVHEQRTHSNVVEQTEESVDSLTVPAPTLDRSTVPPL